MSDGCPGGYAVVPDSAGEQGFGRKMRTQQELMVSETFRL